MLKAVWFDTIPTRVTPNAPASGALLAPKASIRLLGLAYFVLLFARAAVFVLLFARAAVFVLLFARAAVFVLIFARAAVFVLAVAFAFTTLCDYTQTIKHINHERAHR